jgi:ribosomal-protein-serine acetyltransferase
MFSHKIDDDAELRLIAPRHAEELNALVMQNFEHIREWSAWLTDKERPIERTQEWIRQNLERFAKNESFTIGIWHKGAIAGQIDFGNVDWNDRKFEIGYWLGESFQGKGLVTKSCRALINYAFNELKLNRVEMRCAVENKKSRKIPEKLGFREEGILREAGWLHYHFVDEVIYGLLASEWQEKSK